MAYDKDNKCINRIRLLFDSLTNNNIREDIRIDASPSTTNNRVNTTTSVTAKCIITGVKTPHAGYTLIAYLTNDWLFNIYKHMRCLVGCIEYEFGTEHGADTDDVVYVYINNNQCKYL
jgi:hypothetical protein